MIGLILCIVIFSFGIYAVLDTDNGLYKTLVGVLEG